MNNGNVILDRIKSDCDNNVKVIVQDAEDKRTEILDNAKIEAQKKADEIAKKSEQKLKQIKTSAKSRVELETRNALLKRKRSEIDKTVSMLLDYLTQLESNEYFEIIYKLSSKLNGKSGEIFLNEKDLNRLPSDFESKLSQNGLNAKVSKTAVKISGGFVLKCGDVEENMDFSALIAENQDKLEDLVNSELFSE